MKTFRLHKPLPVALLFVLLSLNGKAQQAIHFTVNQPERALMADAGPDQVYDGTSTIVLGGEPSAVGAAGEYTYHWEPAEYLDAHDIANPTVTHLDGPVTFTLTVNARGALCSKVSQVFVDYPNTAEDEKPEVRMYPNPFVEAVNLESTAPIEEVRVTDMTGQTVANHQNLQSTTFRIETAPLAAGMYFFIIRLADGSTTVKKLCKIH